MRLINTYTYELRDIISSNVPGYAILSHCWGENETTLQEYEQVDKTSIRFQSDPKFKKIRDCCQLAVGNGIEWAWIDTCCIDKTSSMELSEAINSMFAWYENALLCYALLEDAQVSGRLDLCRWFTRGWTLQELLAPRVVQFFDADLEYLGDRFTLCDQLELITRIPRKFLTNGPMLDGHMRAPLAAASVAQRMCWAATRTTKRTEDMAYCLLGLFGINMPLLYGEGSRAFKRLQEHIIASSQDESIFAWTSWERHDVTKWQRGILARNPSEFIASADIIPLPFSYRRPPYHITNQGLSIHAIPLSSVQRVLGIWRARPSYMRTTHFTFELQCIRQLTKQRVAIQLTRVDGIHYRTDIHQLNNVSFERGYLESWLLGSFSRIYVQLSSKPPVGSHNQATKRAASLFWTGLMADIVIAAGFLLWNSWVALKPAGTGANIPRLVYSILVWIVLVLGWKWQKREFGRALSFAFLLGCRPALLQAFSKAGTIDFTPAMADHSRVFFFRLPIYVFTFGVLAARMHDESTDLAIRSNITFVCCLLAVDLIFSLITGL